MIENMIVEQYASMFTELSQFVSNFMVNERMKMRRFEEALAFYIRHQLASQPIHLIKTCMSEQLKWSR